MSMSKLTFLHDGDYTRERKRLDLSLYSEKLEGNHLSIWVNWSKEFSDSMRAAASKVTYVGRAVREGLAATALIEDPKERTEKITEISDSLGVALNEAIDEMYVLQAEWWDCTPEEVRRIVEIDEVLHDWIVDQANELKEQYVKSRKKVAKATGST